MTSITGILQEDQYTFLIISFSILLRMRTVSDKSCRENQNTHFIFNNFCFKLFRLRDNVEKYCRSGQATDGNMRMLNACWIPKATNTQLAYVILIAFPPQQRLHERASMLRYTYTACFVYISPTQCTCVFLRILEQLFPCTALTDDSYN